MRKILLLVLVVLGVLSIVTPAFAGVDDRWFAARPVVDSSHTSLWTLFSR